MRRFSQRNQLVTLSEINVTPLLDLAFVLLIIFIIAAPMLESSVNLDLPQTSTPSESEPKREDIRLVEIDKAGGYRLDKHPLTLDQLEYQLALIHRTNRNLIVSVRADKNGRVDNAIQLMDRCIRRGITQLSFATELLEP